MCLLICSQMMHVCIRPPTARPMQAAGSVPDLVYVPLIKCLFLILLPVLSYCSPPTMPNLLPIIFQLVKLG